MKFLTLTKSRISIGRNNKTRVASVIPIIAPSILAVEMSSGLGQLLHLLKTTTAYLIPHLPSCDVTVVGVY